MANDRNQGSGDDLRAALARITALEAKLAEKAEVALLTPEAAERKRLTAANAATRAALKAATKKVNGTAYYVAPTASYRGGDYRLPGIVSIPEDEDPSITWKAVDPKVQLAGVDLPAVPVAVPAATPLPSTLPGPADAPRASDQSVA